jgi:predicted DNA-binding protein (MmcQ/YjbR family)
VSPSRHARDEHPYVGHKGWVGVRLDHEPDWDEVAAIVRRSYRLIAPKRLAALIE